jgi:uroporphyrin-III C-methyltransferase/precorrin-2 dehydrogenase/sirohydrochlorin ferrochelatase
LPSDLNPNTRIDTRARPHDVFKGARLVFIGVEDDKRAAKLAAKARKAGALVNVVDNLPLCDFYTPALVDRGAITIALSSGGAGPILVRDLRSAIESVVAPAVCVSASWTLSPASRPAANTGSAPCAAPPPSWPMPGMKTACAPP